jgi:outer membrane immunogenic protein
MHTFLGCVAISAALIGSAFAADLSRPSSPYGAPTDPWTGIYIGGNAGYDWSSYSMALSTSDGPVPTPRISGGGFVGGGQFGANKTFGSFLLGVEVDGNVGQVGGSGPVTSTNASTDWFATARLRAGWLATPAFLLYATGGGAYGFGAVNTSIAGAPVNLSVPAIGWAAGGGVEWMVVPHVSVAAEYLHIGYDGKGISVVVGNVGGLSLASDSDIVRAKLNFHF